MKALVFDGQLELQEVPRPQFTGQECIVRVLKLIAMVLGQTGCRLSLIGKHTAKMGLIEDCPVERILLDGARQLTREFDLVVEATGSPQGWDLALRLVKPRGTVVLKSTFHGHIVFSPAPICSGRDYCSWVSMRTV